MSKKVPTGYAVIAHRQGFLLEAGDIVCEETGWEPVPQSAYGDEVRLADVFARPIARPIKPSKCRHEDCYEGTARVPDGYAEMHFLAAFKWCRSCGAFFHPTRRKWLRAREPQ